MIKSLPKADLGYEKYKADNTPLTFPELYDIIVEMAEPSCPICHLRFPSVKQNLEHISESHAHIYRQYFRPVIASRN